MNLSMQVFRDVRSSVDLAAAALVDAVGGRPEVVPACRAPCSERRRKRSAHARWSAGATVWRPTSVPKPVVGRVGPGRACVTEASCWTSGPAVDSAPIWRRWLRARTRPSVRSDTGRPTTATGSVNGPTAPLSTRPRPSPRSELVTARTIVDQQVGGLRRSSDIVDVRLNASTYPAALSTKGRLSPRRYSIGRYIQSPPGQTTVWLAALHTGRTTGGLSLSHARPAADGWPTAIGQPTRPTQPFLLSRSINWVVSQFIGRVLVAPSGECTRG